MNPDFIISELKIEEEVLNIYSYGSRIYGTATEESDHDFVIVTKGAMLKSGAFRQNAISNENRTIQGILYSRSGFQNAINSYDISALECLSVREDQVIQQRWPFKIQKWDNREMTKNLISKASNSWHLATLAAKDDWKWMSKKGIFHAMRILTFGLQLKAHQKIINFSACNWFWEDLLKVEDDEFDTRHYIKDRDLLMEKLRQ